MSEKKGRDYKPMAYIELDGGGEPLKIHYVPDPESATKASAVKWGKENLTDEASYVLVRPHGTLEVGEEKVIIKRKAVFRD